MTDLTHGQQCGLRCMADESGTFTVTVADRRLPIKWPITTCHGVALAPFLRGSRGPR